MFQKKSVRFGCGLLFLAILGLAAWLFSGSGGFGRVGSITDGATKIANIGNGKKGYNPRQVYWLGSDEILVMYNDAPKSVPIRVRLSDGKRTPLFSGTNPIAASVRGYRITTALSLDGRYLLWIARIHAKGGNGTLCVLDLQSLAANPAKPVVTKWPRSGAYYQVQWMPDSRHWISYSMSSTGGTPIVMHDRTDVTKAIPLPKMSIGRPRGSLNRIIGGTPAGLVLYAENVKQKLIYYNAFKPSAPPQEFPIPRRNLWPYALSPDGTRILWTEHTDGWLWPIMTNPAMRPLMRNRTFITFAMGQMQNIPTNFYVSKGDGTGLRRIFSLRNTDRNENIDNIQWTRDGKICFTKGDDLYVRPLP